MFTDGFWNLFIILITLGGFLGLYLLVLANGKVKVKASEQEAGDGQVQTMGHVWDGDLAELNNPLPRWWVNMFYITMVFGLLYLLVFPGFGSNPMPFGWTSVGEYEAEMAAAEERYGPLFERYRGEPIPALAADPKALRMGERLYASYCTGCHGSDARGVPGFPNLRDTAWLYGGSPEQIEASILDGRTGAMPPWGAALGEDGVAQVTGYVRSLSGTAVTGVDLAQGKARYGQLCVACHGAEGKGNVAFGAPDLTDGVWLYGGSEAAIAESIANGRQGRMPPHREFLGEAKVHLLAAHVWSLSNGAKQEGAAGVPRD